MLWLITLKYIVFVSYHNAFIWNKCYWSIREYNHKMESSYKSVPSTLNIFDLIWVLVTRHIFIRVSQWYNCAHNPTTMHLACCHAFAWSANQQCVVSAFAYNIGAETLYSLDYKLSNRNVSVSACLLMLMRCALQQHTHNAYSGRFVKASDTYNTKRTESKQTTINKWNAIFSILVKIDIRYWFVVSTNLKWLENSEQ